MTIEQLTDQILDFRDKRDWSQYHKAKDMAAAVASEAAELQEQPKKWLILPSIFF